MPAPAPLFIDSVYLIALRSPADDWRQAALAAAEQVPARHPMVTSDGVILETLAHFSRAPRAFRVQLVEQFQVMRRDPSYTFVSHHQQFQVMRRDPSYTFVSHHQQLMNSALVSFGGEFADSSLSLQDCVSILIMREYVITSILTADQEFARAGFTPLLRRYVA